MKRCHPIFGLNQNLTSTSSRRITLEDSTRRLNCIYLLHGLLHISSYSVILSRLKRHPTGIVFGGRFNAFLGSTEQTAFGVLFVNPVLHNPKYFSIRTPANILEKPRHALCICKASKICRSATWAKISFSLLSSLFVDGKDTESGFRRIQCPSCLFIMPLPGRMMRHFRHQPVRYVDTTHIPSTDRRISNSCTDRTEPLSTRNSKIDGKRRLYYRQSCGPFDQADTLLTSFLNH